MIASTQAVENWNVADSATSLGLGVQCPICKKNHILYKADPRLPLTFRELVCSSKCIEDYKLSPNIIDIE